MEKEQMELFDQMIKSMIKFKNKLNKTDHSQEVLRVQIKETIAKYNKKIKNINEPSETFLIVYGKEKITF